MNAIRRAVIDIGTNSVKVLVADVQGTEVRPVWEESRQTRLGQGLYTSHRLEAGAIANTAAAAADLVAKCGDYEAESVRVIATSAAREARNAGELTDAVERTCGLRAEVITGDQEAEWAFQGVTSDPALAATPLLLLEVGGGSTEFIVGQGAHTHFRQSFPLGTVRLLERFAPSDPPTPQETAGCRHWLREFLEKEVHPSLDPVLRREAASGPLRLVGTGGTASILGSMEWGLETFDRQRLDATRLSAQRLRWRKDELWSLPLEDRKRIAGLPKSRADVILFGAAIYEAVMDRFQFDDLQISTRGLRFGALLAPPRRLVLARSSKEA